MNRPLLAWLSKPELKRGIHFSQPGDEWDFWPYARLSRLTVQMACSLVQAGVQRNDVVCIALRSGPEFVSTFFGAMLAGAIPSPVAPVIAFNDAKVYEGHLLGILRATQPRLTVTHSDLLEGLAGPCAEAGTPLLAFSDLIAQSTETSALPQIEHPEYAMLQFTSGSSARSRGVKISFDALETNVLAIRRWLHWEPDIPFASWLPLHHDMGLVGALICSIVGTNDLWLLQPEHFIRRPLRYLRCFGEFGARLTVTATFGIDYILRRVSRESLTGLNFAHWLGMVVGAERINPQSLQDFFNLLASFGFRRGVIVPAYGMAEATLAITGLPLEQEWTHLNIEPSLSLGSRVVIDTQKKYNAEIAGCGKALEGVSVRIVNEENMELPELTIGEIVVLGKSLAAGYIESSESPSLTRLSGGLLHTGDAGFLFGQELFVVGRLGDSIKMRGLMVFGEDLEIALTAIGVPRERVAALLGFFHEQPTIVVVFEKFQDEWYSRAQSIIRYYVGEASVVLLNAPKGTIMRTSSGKTKRRHLWQSFLAGTLPGKRIVPAQAPDSTKEWTSA